VQVNHLHGNLCTLQCNPTILPCNQQLVRASQSFALHCFFIALHLAQIAKNHPDQLAKIRQIHDIESDKRRNEFLRSPNYSRSINYTIMRVIPMARKKRSSTILTYAERRLIALEAIDTELDLGNGLTTQAISKEIEETRTQLKSYNAILVEIDQLKETLEEKERSLEELVDRTASAVLGAYGKGSSQYKSVSDVRKTTRRNTPKVEPIQPAERSA
jgi:RNA-binding protein YhbY